jgi:hypothetical protein
MIAQPSEAAACCPEAVAMHQDKIRQKVEELLDFCTSCDQPFFGFETALCAWMMILGQLFVRLFLLARHSRLEMDFYLQDGPYRRGDLYAERTQSQRELWSILARWGDSHQVLHFTIISSPDYFSSCL